MQQEHYYITHTIDYCIYEKYLINLISKIFNYTKSCIYIFEILINKLCMLFKTNKVNCLEILKLNGFQFKNNLLTNKIFKK